MSKNLALMHDSNKNFLEAKGKIEAFMDAVEKEYPGFQYVFLALNPDNIWVRHSDCPSITDLIGRIEVAKLWKYQKWMEEK